MTVQRGSYALVALRNERVRKRFARCAEKLEGGPYTAFVAATADEAIAFVDELCEEGKETFLILVVTDRMRGGKVLGHLSAITELSRTPTVVVSEASEERIKSIAHGLPFSVLRTSSKKGFLTAVSVAVQRRRLEVIQK